MRTFLWIVHAPSRLRATLEERYRTPPEPGSVIFAEQDAETWTALTPNLHAADSANDGRAIRWMIVAGGPGTALLDIGEGEDSNLATGQAMAEQRRRFLRRRQAYLVYLLTDLTWHAWRRYVAVTHLPGTRSRVRTIKTSDLIAITPDISPEDNQSLGAAAQSLTNSLQTMATLVGDSEAFRRMALRLFAKFIGETMSEAEFDQILTQGAITHEQTPDPGPDQRADDGDPSDGDGAAAHRRTAPSLTPTTARGYTNGTGV
jgi:hypothetical protein